MRNLDSTDAIIITGAAVAAVTGGAALAISISNSSKIKATQAVAIDAQNRAIDAQQSVGRIAGIVKKTANTTTLTEAEKAWLEAW